MTLEWNSLKVLILFPVDLLLDFEMLIRMFDRKKHSTYFNSNKSFRKKNLLFVRLLCKLCTFSYIPQNKIIRLSFMSLCDIITEFVAM